MFPLNFIFMTHPNAPPPPPPHTHTHAKRYSDSKTYGENDRFQSYDYFYMQIGLFTVKKRLICM